MQGDRQVVDDDKESVVPAIEYSPFVWACGYALFCDELTELCLIEQAHVCIHISMA